MDTDMDNDAHTKKYMKLKLASTPTGLIYLHLQQGYSQVRTFPNKDQLWKKEEIFKATVLLSSAQINDE